MMLSVRVRRCNDEASARGKIDGTRPFPASGYFLRLEATGGMVIRRSNILHPPDRATRREHQHPREHGGRPRGTAGGDVRNSRRSLGICIASGDGIVPVGGKLLRDQHSHGVPTVFDKVVEMKEAVDCVLLFMVFRSLLFAVDTHYVNFVLCWMCWNVATQKTAKKNGENDGCTIFASFACFFFFGVFKK